MTLNDWFIQNKGRVTRRNFAKRVEVAPATITGYCQGKIMPSLRVAVRIAEATDHAVTAVDFMPSGGAA